MGFVLAVSSFNVCILFGRSVFLLCGCCSGGFVFFIVWMLVARSLFFFIVCMLFVMFRFFIVLILFARPRVFL